PGGRPEYVPRSIRGRAGGGRAPSRRRPRARALPPPRAPAAASSAPPRGRDGRASRARDALLRRPRHGVSLDAGKPQVAAGRVAPPALRPGLVLLDVLGREERVAHPPTQETQESHRPTGYAASQRPGGAPPAARPAPR